MTGVRGEAGPGAGRIVLRGGTVSDGLGGEPFIADVVVTDGVIVGVHRDGDGDGPRLPPGFEATVVDARGLDVLPGFIDVHSHDDAALFRTGGLAPKVGQGVTTSVIGNCGLGVAPTSSGLEDNAAPVLGAFPPGGRSSPRSWAAFGEYLSTVAASARAVNTVALVPHAPLRIATMGFERRPASPAETDAIAGAAADALDAGATGISLGLMYTPGDSATRDELLALAAVAASRDRLLVAHLRNEADHLRAAIDELADLGRASGAAVHISHLKVTGPRNAGTMPQIIEHLDALRDEGVDVTADVYPYDAGSTTVLSLFPPALQGDLVERLSAPATRREVLATLDVPWAGSTLENQWRAIGPSRILLAGFQDPGLSRFEGMSVSDIATDLSLPPEDALADLVVATGARLTVIVFHTDPAGMRTALSWPHTLVGSDGLPREEGFVHPRLFGTFSRALTLGVLPRREAVRRMTSAAAARFGIAGRGSVAVGAAADLQLLDPATYADRATYETPRLGPAGVRGVWVNGTPVAAAPAGRFLPACPRPFLPDR